MAQSVRDVWNNLFDTGGRVRDGSVKLLARKLEDRSKLDFVFPQGGGANPVIFELPFYENIQVIETKGARLQRYEPVGRSNPLHAYLGGKPKIFRLDFNLTLPHLQFESTALSISRFMGRSLMSTKEYNRTVFLSNPDNVGPTQEGVKVEGPIMKKVQDAIRHFFGIQTTVPTENDSTTRTWENTAALAVLLWWINLIRASVVNNESNPLLGPPIVRLTHGMLYSNIPCVATNYSIEIDGEAGYELRTLAPRRVAVSMTLEETRSGDFESFDPTDIIKKDNNAGWEAILEHGSTDPMAYGSLGKSNLYGEE